MTENFIPSVEALPVLFQTLFRHNLCGVAFISWPSKTILDCNQKYSEIVGWPIRKLRGKDYTLISHPADIQGDEETARELIDLSEDAEVYIATKRYLTEMGREVRCHLEARPIHVNGKFCYFMSMIRKITDPEPQNDSELKLPILNFKWVLKNWKIVSPIILSLGLGIGLHFKEVFKQEAQINSMGWVIGKLQEKVDKLEKENDTLRKRVKVK